MSDQPPPHPVPPDGVEGTATPRMYSQIIRSNLDEIACDCVPADFARELERELNEAKADLTLAKVFETKDLDTAQQRIAALEAEVEAEKEEVLIEKLQLNAAIDQLTAARATIATLEASGKRMVRAFDKLEYEAVSDPYECLNAADELRALLARHAAATQGGGEETKT